MLQNAEQKLNVIRIIHTLIWMFFVTLIFYVLYCGISGNISKYTWLAIGLVFIEVLTIVAFNFTCPITLFARRYSDSQADNFDIYIPWWLAKYNQPIFGTIFTIALILVLLQVFDVLPMGK